MPAHHQPAMASLGDPVPYGLVVQVVAYLVDHLVARAEVDHLAILLEDLQVLGRPLGQHEGAAGRDLEGAHGALVAIGMSEQAEADPGPTKGEAIRPSEDDAAIVWPRERHPVPAATVEAKAHARDRGCRLHVGVPTRVSRSSEGQVA